MSHHWILVLTLFNSAGQDQQTVDSYDTKAECLRDKDSTDNQQILRDYMKMYQAVGSLGCRVETDKEER